MTFIFQLPAGGLTLKRSPQLIFTGKICSGPVFWCEFNAKSQKLNLVKHTYAKI